jgi:uncharacterized protein YecT (DUF1311 family)
MRRINRGVADMEAKMRRAGLTLLFAFACLAMPRAVFAQTPAPADGVAACVAAAGASRAGLNACKGVVLEACTETPGGETTGGMVACYEGEARAWTALLDAAVVRAQAGESRAAVFQQSQEAWRAWRQADCRYQASYYEGGSLARVLAASCYADLTADRAIALIYAERTENE